ncbi:hypothetical protein NQ318_019321 [Aromia moschata]|uniref:Uncharacterized protein n=1 Tax=Aromia moschata TaxID=1265417 RepID=A0AAV8YBF7_9CUCU|nr:hypothetical protein NQ318_019321 [Aromia moschata]
MLKPSIGNSTQFPGDDPGVCTPAHKFLNGLNGLKRNVKRPRRIRAPDDPQRQKRTKTLKKPFAQKWRQNSCPEQKESRMNIHADILDNIDTDPGLLDTVTLKWARFESVEAVKAKATEVLNQLTEADFQH